MTLWLILSLMTAAAIFAVLWPLSRRGSAAVQGQDIAVYRDQLDEVERDRKSGLIGRSRGRSGQARNFAPPAGRGRQGRTEKGRVQKPNRKGSRPKPRGRAVAAARRSAGRAARAAGRCRRSSI